MGRLPRIGETVDANGYRFEVADTDAIRSHYKSSGFDPAAILRPLLEKKLDALPDFRDRARKP